MDENAPLMFPDVRWIAIFPGGKIFICYCTPCRQSPIIKTLSFNL